MQKEEYMPIKTSDIAQFSNIPSYEIGTVSDPIEKDSIVSFVLPFEEMSLVDYLMIQSQDMRIFLPSFQSLTVILKKEILIPSRNFEMNLLH